MRNLHNYKKNWTQIISYWISKRLHAFLLVTVLYFHCSHQQSAKRTAGSFKAVCVSTVSLFDTRWPAYSVFFFSPENREVLDPSGVGLYYQGRKYRQSCWYRKGSEWQRHWEVFGMHLWVHWHFYKEVKALLRILPKHHMHLFVYTHTRNKQNICSATWQHCNPYHQHWGYKRKFLCI